VSLEKKGFKEEFLFPDIQSVIYGNVFRHLDGVVVTLTNMTTIGFVTQEHDALIELVNRKLAETPSSCL